MPREAGSAHPWYCVLPACLRSHLTVQSPPCTWKEVQYSNCTYSEQIQKTVVPLNTYGAVADLKSEKMTEISSKHLV